MTNVPFVGLASKFNRLLPKASSVLTGPTFTTWCEWTSLEDVPHPPEPHPEEQPVLIPVADCESMTGSKGSTIGTFQILGNRSHKHKWSLVSTSQRYGGSNNTESAGIRVPATNIAER